MSKSYSELITFNSFKERYEYLKLLKGVGAETFGSSRYLNQMLYHDSEWKNIRTRVIIRDHGCDLGIPGREIQSGICIHHIDPICKDDVVNRSSKVFDLNNLICCSHKTHNAIHYGNGENLFYELTVRSSNDTCPWKDRV